MKRFFIYTLICSLIALIGCDKNDEVMNDLATKNGKKVTVTANIQGDAATRVTLIPDTDESENPIVKVDWKASGETFNAYADGAAKPITFTQIDGTNRFEGTLPETPAEYTLYYGAKDYVLSAQNGTLNEAYVLMQATTDFSTTTIDFAHKTAILKPTFKVGNAALATNTITKIVMGGIKKPTATTESGSITVTPSDLEDIYIFLPAFTNYEGPHTFTFNVTAAGQDYEATLTIPNEKSIEAGKFYTATIKLTIPYLTFTAQEEQTFKMNTEFDCTLPNTLEYSVNNGEWKPVKTIVNAISFGGANGNLRLRGKSSTGTAENDVRYSKIVFGDNNTPVACTGDIRTLVDWENYNTVSTSSARFGGLFNGCSVLTTAPALPATSLADHCYFEMFFGCTSLTAAPVLPATTLANHCYQSMFSGCTSLATAPTLPATTLADFCYAYMFYGCTSLATAPALPATTLALNCYFYMFHGCSNLTTAPATLPAITLKDNCYNFMFQGCTSLATAPDLPATTLANSCYANMFYGCTSLTTAPTLPATTLADFCYSAMFYGCTSLATAPALPATTLVKNCYAYMFYGCTSLATAPALPATTLVKNCYKFMFYGCTSLATAPDLPATTLAEGCYQSMFYGCTSLTASPALPATSLANNCYYEMFYGCSKLNSITMLATNISASDCLYEWVNGVSTTGTFTKAAAMTSLPTGASGIPEGWTVQNYSATP